MNIVVIGSGFGDLSAAIHLQAQGHQVIHLYFVGAGTHPGAGLPGVMSSGKIVAKMIGSDCLAKRSDNR